MSDERIEYILAKARLTKYKNLFQETKIPFDVFENMSKEDLFIVGINDEDDQNNLLNHLRIRRNKPLYKKFYEPQNFDLENVLEDAGLELIRLSINIQLMKRALLKRTHKYYDTFITANATSSSAIFKFLDVALAELDHMQSYYSVMLNKGDDTSNAPNTFWIDPRSIVAALVSSAIVGAVIFAVKMKSS